MDIEKLINLALESGFSAAGELNMKSLVFMPEVRELCRADKCHSYGKNWRCPPVVGSIEESFKKAAGYSHGIIVETIGLMEDDFDYETMKSSQEKHNANFIALMRKIKAGNPGTLGMSAGACRICNKCTYPDEPCRNPDDAYTSMEAYGLWVSRVCELSGMKYNNGKNTITYISCILVN